MLHAIRHYLAAVSSGVALATLVAIPAQGYPTPGYQVRTEVTSSADNHSGGASYNGVQAGAFTGSNSPSTVTTSVTPGDTIGDAKSASSHVRATPPTGLTAEGFAAADLASGKLRVLAIDSCGTSCTGGVGGFTSTFGRAEFRDTLTFTIDGAGADTKTLIGITFQVDGLMTRADPDVGSGSFNAELALRETATSAVTYGLLNNADTDGFTEVASSGFGNEFVNNGSVESDFVTLSATEMVWHGFYELTGPIVTRDIRMSMFFNCNNGVSCDFDSTGSVSLELPQGVAFTSASGVFLTAAPNQEPGQVPEPASLALFSLGLLGLAVRRRQGA